QRLGKAAEKVSTQVWPDEQVRIAAETNAQLKGVVPLLHYDMSATAKKAERLLGWTPRSREEAIISCAESLIRLGLLRG
ncbi:MAG: aldehyde reductase, partial [Mesorhizobium sp.]